MICNPDNGKIQLAPAWEGPVRTAAATTPYVTESRLAIPRSPRFYAGKITFVADEQAAAAMLDFARQRSISHVGIDTEFRYDRPGVVIDRQRTADDPSSVRPLLLSIALAEPNDGGDGALFRFVVDLRVPEVLPALRELFRQPWMFVSHFARAELFCFWKLGLPDPASLWDTWVHEKAVHLGLHHKKYLVAPTADGAAEALAEDQAEEDKEFSLALPATCLRHHVDYPLAGDKARLQQSFLNHPEGAPFSEEQVRYSSADSEAVVRLYLPQVSEAAQAGLLGHLVNIEMPWVTTSARMGWRGVRVDAEQGQNLKAAGERHLEVLQPKLAAMGVDNANSFKQLTDFFDRQGILELFRRNGKISFDREQLRTFESRHPALPLIRASRRIRDLSEEKLLSGEFVGTDGRVHPDYRQLGTATGRQSSRWPNIMGLGKVFRPLIVPEAGRGIGEADWCQIEVGIAAAVYGDDKLIALFNSDDVYSAMAKHFHRATLTEEDLGLAGALFKKRFPKQRDQMKICTLGIIYGLTPYGLSLRLDTSEAEAAALQQRFMTMFPTLSQALDDLPRYGALCGHVSTISGLRRHRSGSGKLTKWERNWMTNHPVQGSAADVFKAAGNRLDKLYRQYDAWLIVPMHDAFVFEAPLDRLQEVAKLTEGVMIAAVQEFFPMLLPKVDVNIRQPNCWNKDGHADSLDRWMEDPTFAF